MHVCKFEEEMNESRIKRTGRHSLIAVDRFPSFIAPGDQLLSLACNIVRHHFSSFICGLFSLLRISEQHLSFEDCRIKTKTNACGVLEMDILGAEHVRFTSKDLLMHPASHITIPGYTEAAKRYSDTGNRTRALSAL
jgi:hypothetical protein